MEYPALFLVVAQVSGKCSSDVAVGGVPNVGHPPASMLAVAEAPQACFQGFAPRGPNERLAVGLHA